MAKSLLGPTLGALANDLSAEEEKREIVKLNENLKNKDLFWRTPSFNFEMSSEPISAIEKERAYLLFLSAMYPPKTKTEIENQIEVSKLKVARQTLQLTVEKVAAMMQIGESTYQNYEDGELNGSVTLSKLRAAAEALECELVYEIRSKDGGELIRRIWEPAFEDTKNHGYLKKCVANRRPHALHQLIIEKLKNPKFRRKMNWSKQATRL